VAVTGGLTLADGVVLGVTLMVGLGLGVGLWLALGLVLGELDGGHGLGLFEWCPYPLGVGAP
jgi:hypothetical protein